MGEGTVRIDGRFSGEIESEGTLVVGSGAELEADIRVEKVLIQGCVTGDGRAARCIELHAPGRVKSTLAAPELLIEKGVIFDGQCHLSDIASGADDEPVPPTEDEDSRDEP